MTKAKQTTKEYKDNATKWNERNEVIKQTTKLVDTPKEHQVRILQCDNSEVCNEVKQAIKSTREATAKEIIDDFVKMCGDDETLWSDEIDQLRKKYHAVVRDKRIVQENDKELE